MRIGLYNLEPNIINTAMMQVSQYFKELGYIVEIYKGPLAHDEYDQIWAFSIFKKTPKHYVTSDMVCGGTGFDIPGWYRPQLPPEIRSCDYDYSVFPECDYSIVWFSRGCIRNCGFCIVREKEGYIYKVEPKALNPNGKFIKVMDNNFFACPGWQDHIRQLQEWGQPVDFQGVDARLLTPEMCEALNSLHHEHQIHIAWDYPKQDLIPKLKEITSIIKPYKLMCYVLIGYGSTPDQDLMRVEKLRVLNIDPFVMPFDKTDRYQKDFARWVNHKAVFKTVQWSEYKKVEA
jgi:hypothetical protein